MAFSNIKLDRSERVIYDQADYPVYIRRGRLSYYPNYTAESHWHDDIELIFVLSGKMKYNINGEIVLLEAGEGIFVNARQFHFGYSERKEECEYICVLFHPVLLCVSGTIEQRYINPLLFNEHTPFCHLKHDCGWQYDILSSIRRIYEVQSEALSELKIQRLLFDVWIALCENIISIQKAELASNHHLSALKEMVSFLNDKYDEKLSLEEIAASGKVGKTTCCTIFRRYVNKTPNEYLTELRLLKSMELLRNTDMTVLEISYAVGFFGASYFSETFRKFYGCTPSEYRKRTQGI